MLVIVASLAGARLLQGTAVGASLNARVYAVVHAFAQVTDVLYVCCSPCTWMQSQNVHQYGAL